MYVTPSHQFPLSVTMTLPRRQALLAWAERNNAAIIEDDYDSEFRFGGRPLEPLQTLDAKGRVIYVGSFSKTMLPTLRLGFLVTPPSLREALHKAKFVSDWHSSTPAQAALARFIDEGAFARHLRRMSAIYRERHQILADAISRDFAEHLELIPSTTGLHLTALARRMSVDQIAEVARRAADHGVAVQVLSKFAVGESPRAGFMLGYGAIPTAQHRRRVAFAARLFRSRARIAGPHLERLHHARRGSKRLRAGSSRCMASRSGSAISIVGFCKRSAALGLACGETFTAGNRWKASSEIRSRQRFGLTAQCCADRQAGRQRPHEGPHDSRAHREDRQPRQQGCHPDSGGELFAPGR